MPVRAIKRLETEGLRLYLPHAVVDSYYIEFVDNTFEILVERHFDKTGKVLQTIGEQVICTVDVDSAVGRHPFFELCHHPLIRKYGVLRNEYMEVIYQNKIHEREVGLIFKKTVQERDPVFPEREVEESDIRTASE